MAINYVKTISDYIKTGAYNYSELEGRLDVLFVEGKITQEERDELLTIAANSAQDSAQIDIVSKLKELEDRIYALENPVEPDYPIYVPGYVTKKGEIIRFDYDKDGNYDLLRYDGGRAETSLSPGKIDGWHVVDAQGNILGTYYKGEFTPAN
jgi:hypothetical protein